MLAPETFPRVDDNCVRTHRSVAAFWSLTQGHLDSLLLAGDKEEDICLDFSGNSPLPQEAASVAESEMSARLQVDKAERQVDKAACQGFLDVGRRHDGPGSVTKDFATPGRATRVRFVSATPFLGPSGQCRESQVAGTSRGVCHKRGILSLDSQPFAPEGDTVSPKLVCHTSLTKWYVTEAVSAPAPKGCRTV